MMSIQIISETNDCKVTLKDEFHIFKKQMVTIKQIYEKKNTYIQKYFSCKMYFTKQASITFKGINEHFVSEIVILLKPIFMPT